MYKTGKYLLYKENMNLRKMPKASAEIIAVLQHGTNALQSLCVLAK